MTPIIAHRGNSAEAPENTLAAFRQAIELGADGVELDVHASHDGVPVVIHDSRLERTTDGHGFVRERSARELAALDAGRWFDAAFAGEGVPTLAAALALLAPRGLEIHIELKTAEFEFTGLVQAVMAEVIAAGVAGRVVLSSFNHHSLLDVRANAPDLPCAALISGRLIEPWRYVALHGFQALHLPYASVDEALVRGCHEAGLAVRTYTADEASVAERLMGLGVDGIITNQPRRLLELRGPWASALPDGSAP